VSDLIFDKTTYVRVLIEPAEWLVVLAGQTFSTIQDYETHGTYAEAVAAGYEGDEASDAGDA